eukprot:COSAG05_NODE_418_length_10011_cov_18.784100_4_plen_264_part_00
MLSYFESQKDHIFRHVHVLIYVFDIESSLRANGSQDSKDSEYFVSCLKALQEHSQDVKIFCLVHKMDLVPDAERATIFQQQEAALQLLALPYASEISCFATSIWDASLYRAWSKMVHSLIPNVLALESQLRSFSQICHADEVVLFERATFLVICHASTGQPQTYADPHRFEKISNIIKQFKLSCSKSQVQFEKMEVQNSRFTAFIDVFTSNTYLMAILSPSAGAVEPAVPLLNIALARQHFEQIVAPTPRPNQSGDAAAVSPA